MACVEVKHGWTFPLFFRVIFKSIETRHQHLVWVVTEAAVLEDLEDAIVGHWLLFFKYVDSLSRQGKVVCKFNCSKQKKLNQQLLKMLTIARQFSKTSFWMARQISVTLCRRSIWRLRDINYRFQLIPSYKSHGVKSGELACHYTGPLQPIHLPGKTLS